MNDPMLGFGRESSDKKEEKDEENLKILLLGKNPSRSNNQKTRVSFGYRILINDVSSAVKRKSSP